MVESGAKWNKVVDFTLNVLGKYHSVADHFEAGDWICIKANTIIR